MSLALASIDLDFGDLTPENQVLALALLAVLTVGAYLLVRDVVRAFKPAPPTPVTFTAIWQPPPPREAPPRSVRRRTKNRRRRGDR